MSNPDRTWGKTLYSTRPDFIPEDERSIPPDQQRLSIRYEKKHRKGKPVTIIEGFQGPETELKELAKWLKTRCGAGGSVKDRMILIQGDCRDKVIRLLKEKGFRMR